MVICSFTSFAAVFFFIGQDSGWALSRWQLERERQLWECRRGLQTPFFPRPHAALTVHRVRRWQLSARTKGRNSKGKSLQPFTYISISRTRDVRRVPTWLLVGGWGQLLQGSIWKLFSFNDKLLWLTFWRSRRIPHTMHHIAAETPSPLPTAWNFNVSYQSKFKLHWYNEMLEYFYHESHYHTIWRVTGHIQSARHIHNWIRIIQTVWYARALKLSTMGTIFNDF